MCPRRRPGTRGAARPDTPALPPWLDEGLADDLGQAEIGADGELTPGRIGGSATRVGNTIDFSGGRAAAILLRDADERGELIELERLLELDWQGFVGSRDRSLHYAQSSFFLRFLLDGGDPELAAGLQGFLRDVAAGGTVDGEALTQRLGADWSELEVRFRAWVRMLADAVEEAGSV